MEYTLLGFDDSTGQLTVAFAGHPRQVLDVPIEDGKYISGPALLDYIRGFVPTWHYERQALIKSGVVGADAVLAMCGSSKAEEDAPNYAELRLQAYPPAADYLDAIVRGDTDAQQEYVDACLAVKARFPKPIPVPVSAAVLAERREL